MANIKINTKQEGDNGYIAFYNGKQGEVYAPSLYEAKKRAVAFFKPKKSQEHMVHCVIAERADGSEVVHTADF